MSESSSQLFSSCVSLLVINPNLVGLNEVFKIVMSGSSVVCRLVKEIYNYISSNGL